MKWMVNMEEILCDIDLRVGEIDMERTYVCMCQMMN